MAEVLPGGTTVRVYRVSGVPGSTLTTATSLVPIRTETPPVEAPQPGSAVLLVALTGYGQDEDRRRAEEAGFDVHLVKPVDASTLSGLLTLPRSGRASGMNKK